MRISDWSSDVCSSDLAVDGRAQRVDYASAQFGANRHFKNATGGFDRVAFGHAGVIAQNNRAYRIALEVERTSEHSSEESRVGKECVSKCRSRWSQYY